jgi:DNA-binding CsgD family transcriptional regulator
MSTVAASGDFLSILPASPNSHIADLVDHIGESDFNLVLTRFLHQTLAADHCALCCFVDERPMKVGAVSWDGSGSADLAFSRYINQDHWRGDPSMRQAIMTRDTAPMLFQLDIDRMPPSVLRDVIYRRQGVRERVLLYGVARGIRIGISILRSDETGKFTDRELADFQAMGGDLIAIAGKHIDLVGQRSNLTKALTDLETIEERMMLAPEGLTAREAQVCARLLYGNSLFGIATSLGLGEETIKTYRKRAYSRLGIVSKRDLLVWYIKLWESLAGPSRMN